MGGAEDVDPVDLERIDDADRPADREVGDQIAVNFFAPLGQELLGVVQPLVSELFRKNNGGGHDRTRECTAPGFVDPGDLGKADGAEATFVTESAAAAHETVFYTTRGRGEDGSARGGAAAAIVGRRNAQRRTPNAERRMEEGAARRIGAYFVGATGLTGRVSAWRKNGHPESAETTRDLARGV